MERKVRENDFEIDIKQVAEHLGMTEKEYSEELAVNERIREYTRKHKSLSINDIINGALSKK